MLESWKIHWLKIIWNVKNIWLRESLIKNTLLFLQKKKKEHSLIEYTLWYNHSVVPFYKNNYFCIFNNLKVNSSKMNDSRVVQGDSMGVFREGVDLYVENLWARHDFLKKHCGPDPSPTLQELADEILFSFTQTISKN